MVDLRAPLEPFGEGSGADGHDHELLQVHAVVGVLAAVEDVQHRHRQHPRGHPAQILIQGQVARERGSLGDGQRDAQDSVGTEVALVGSAVELAHEPVDVDLVGGVEVDDLGGDDLVDVLDGLGDALAKVAALVAVAELNRLELARGRARGHGRAALGATAEVDVDFYGRVAARIERLAGPDVADACVHCSTPPC